MGSGDHMLKNIVSYIDLVNVFVARVAKWLFLILALIIFYEVFMRYIFNSPTIWVYDLSYMLNGSAFVLGMGYTLLMKKHVRVDVFFNKFKKRTQSLLNMIFTILLFYPTFGILLYKLIPWVLASWATQEKATGSFWMPPIYPLKTILLLAVILLILQGISEFIKDCLTFFGDKKRWKVNEYVES